MKIRNSVCAFFCLWVVFLGTAWGSSSTKITYTYDESNKRIAQDIENQGKTLFIYDVQNRLIAEMDAAGNTLVEYIYLNGRQIAMANKTGQPDEALYLTHTDHLGTPEVMTDTAGNEVWRREQTPFGETVKIEGSITQNMRFLGQRYHEETGLHYNLNRDYNPRIGQYVQSDPIGMAGGINTFVYANNNPVMYSDPEGLNPLLLLYGAYKLGSFAYDLYDTYQTATDPCSSSWDIAMAIGGTGADLLNPLGAGLSRAVKVGKVAKSAGRSGKQDRLKELANDPKLGSADRGWIKQEQNAIKRGNRKTIRNPPGKDLAHERGREAAKGYGCEHSNLQDRDPHRLQHKYDNFGRKNGERPPQ